MSCKLHRQGGAAAASARLWVPSGDPVCRAGGPGAPDLDAQVQAAYQQGVAAGEQAGAQKAAAQLAPAMQRLSSVIQELANARAQARREAEESMVELALAVARRILMREIATDPEAVLGLVKSALERINAREVHRLRLSPEDAEMVRQNRDVISLPPSVEIAADPGLKPGSALFETARGEVDASVQTQLEEIQRGFADLVARRRR
jgi:flagellar assembly protein FliH